MIVSTLLNQINLLNSPICVVGSGVVGLSIARKLSKTNPVIVFEKEKEIGGKAQTYNYFGGRADIGPLLIAKTNYNVIKLAKELDVEFEVVERKFVFEYDTHGKITPYNPFVVDGSTEYKEKTKFIMLVDKFIQIRLTLKLEYGYLELDTKLKVSFSQWLNDNGLQGLTRHIEPILLVQGYGLINEIPALYQLMFFTVDRIKLMLDPNQEFLVFKTGIGKLIKKMSLNIPILTETEVVKIDYVNKRLTYVYKGVKFTQKCSKFIISIPLTQNLIEKLVDTETSMIFSGIDTHDYMTTVYKDLGLKHSYYIEKYNNMPVGTGEVVAIIRQDRLVTAYSWNKNTSQCNRNNGCNSRNMMLIKADAFMDKFMGSNTSALLAKQWMYFPHASFAVLSSDFFVKLDAIQGKNEVYFASTLLGFELVNDAIGVANFILDKYLSAK